MNNLAELQERIESLDANLSSALTHAQDLPARLQAIESHLTTLAPQAEQAQAAVARANRVRLRLEQAQALIQNLSDSDKADASELKALRELAVKLDDQLRAMEPHAEAMNQAATQVRAIELALPARRRKVQQTKPLTATLKRLLDETGDLTKDLPPAEPEPALAQAPVLMPQPVTQPDLQDVREQLPRHPAKQYHTRERQDIKRIVVHQTGFPAATPPAALARVQIIRHDAPGIPYHFVISGDGDIFWTQALENVLQSNLHYEINADSVAVALAGDFSSQAPEPAQLAAAADLIAWLASELELGLDRVVGRNELEAVVSPGAQWRRGARYKKTLLGLVRARLNE